MLTRGTVPNRVGKAANNGWIYGGIRLSTAKHSRPPVSHEPPPMSEVKLYKITGDLRKRGDKLHFTKQIRALKKEHALQSLYADMGSRHKARKFDISIKSVEEIAEPGESA